MTRFSTRTPSHGTSPPPSISTCSLVRSLAVALGVWGMASSAQARPSGPIRFCETYPSSPDCMGRLTTCNTCHTSTDPPQWNDYGAAVLSGLGGADFDAGLADALRGIEDQDDDRDGETNLDEILVGTNPGRADSLWQPVPQSTGEPNPWYSLGAYDPPLAYRRMMILYCGHSPTYEQAQEFAARDPEQQRTALHEALSVCLDGEYWRQTGLRELADPRIKPVWAIGADTELYANGFRIVQGDYHWDYRLWRYVLSDDRDLRELLTAQYHVEDDGQGGLVPIEGIIADPDFSDPEQGLAGGQPLQPQYRAGMITTQWFLMLNTMFSAIPRTTAAQAYRAYLGMDISRDEGIIPVAGEPLDVDDKGVAAPVCSHCHSTLDPLAYAFSYYRGVQTGLNGTYDEHRPQLLAEAGLLPGWDPQRQQSVLLGQPVDTVVEWGRVASESTYFRHAMTRMFFEHALGRAPRPGDLPPLEQVAAAMPADGYSANRIIHRIVDTEAFGAP